jgi:hypothetical protein
MNFKSEGEARDAVTILNSEGTIDRCPIVMDVCHPDCVCFKKAMYVHTLGCLDRTEQHTVLFPRCIHKDIDREVRRYMVGCLNGE